VWMLKEGYCKRLILRKTAPLSADERQASSGQHDVVMKALSQDVKFLAFVPFIAPAGSRLSRFPTGVSSNGAR